MGGALRFIYDDFGWDAAATSHNRRQSQAANGRNNITTLSGHRNDLSAQPILGGPAGIDDRAS